jgi:hypothetical protein
MDSFVTACGLQGFPGFFFGREKQKKRKEGKCLKP